MSAAQKRLIDANVVLRYLLRDDESLFARSSPFLERVKTGEAQAVVLDCLLGARARSTGAPLFTFDEALDRTCRPQ